MLKQLLSKHNNINNIIPIYLTIIYIRWIISLQDTNYYVSKRNRQTEFAVKNFYIKETTCSDDFIEFI